MMNDHSYFWTKTHVNKDVPVWFWKKKLYVLEGLFVALLKDTSLAEVLHKIRLLWTESFFFSVGTIFSATPDKAQREHVHEGTYYFIGWTCHFHVTSRELECNSLGKKECVGWVDSSESLGQIYAGSGMWSLNDLESRWGQPWKPFQLAQRPTSLSPILLSPFCPTR